MPPFVFKLRRATYLEWVNRNPVLELGEPGYERDTRKLKIGDGTTPWNDLDYIVASSLTPGSSEALLVEHINAELPHPIYDDGPSLNLLYQNAKV